MYESSEILHITILSFTLYRWNWSVILKPRSSQLYLRYYVSHPMAIMKLNLIALVVLLSSTITPATAICSSGGSAVVITVTVTVTGRTDHIKL